MGKIARVVIILTLIGEFIFIIKQFISFGPVIGTTDTPGIYLLLRTCTLALVFASFFILFKYIFKKKEVGIKKIELGAIIIQLLTTILLVLFYEGFSRLFQIIYYLGILSTIIGVIGYYKLRDFVDIGFILWGLGILVWISSFYFGVYVT